MNMSEARNAFTEEPEDTLENYRPINVVATIAFVVSLGSFLAVTDMFFLFIPVLAIILSLIGYAIFWTSSRQLVGRRLCAIALCIGLFVTTWLVGYQGMRRWFIIRQAAPIAQEWIEYVRRGELYKAHQLTLPFMKRELAETDLEKHYTKLDFQSGMSEAEQQLFKESAPMGKFKEFTSQEPLKTIIAEARQADFELVRTEVHRRSKKDQDIVAQVYRMNYQAKGNPQSLEFRVVLVRQDLGDYFQAHWYVGRVMFPSEPLTF